MVYKLSNSNNEIVLDGYSILFCSQIPDLRIAEGVRVYDNAKAIVPYIACRGVELQTHPNSTSELLGLSVDT